MSDPITPLTPEQTAAQEAKAAKEGYLHRDAVALDIFADEVAGGPMDETISSRLARAAESGKWWGKLGCKTLNLFQANHGPKAQAGDVERAQSEVEREQASGGIDHGA